MATAIPHKVTLPETSLHGPALARLLSPGLADIVIAWTGTGNNFLNVEASPDGSIWTNKVTLKETSIARPALAVHEGRLFLAWTGTDAAHHLNIESSADLRNFDRKVEFNETSDFGPALCVFKNIMYIAWTGTGNNWLNIAQFVNGRMENKTTIQTETAYGPLALAADNEYLFIGWTGTDPKHHLNVMRSKDGKAFLNKVTIPEESPSGPALLFEGNRLIIGWTGVGNNWLNSESSIDQGIKWGNKSTDQNNTAIEGPALTFGFVGWTGTDPQHHLNVALGTN